MALKQFWKGKRVLITGHTGFKGSWLSLWLTSLGAHVGGYALKPPSQPNCYDLWSMKNDVESSIADIEDARKFNHFFKNFKPEIIFHMAAQALVRKSYQEPKRTYTTNVIGTINVFEAVRTYGHTKAIINVTTDKCYLNNEHGRAFKETDPLGGYDPYSASKACSEILTASYRDAFFNPASFKNHGVAVSSARSGNVIGGGDWSSDRLIPDFVRAILKGNTIQVRSPEAIRPWQHVLDPLHGYLMLAQQLYQRGSKFTGAWNFGPNANDIRTVRWVVSHLCSLWGDARYELDRSTHPHEAQYLKLNCMKSHKILGWKSKWNVHTSLQKIVQWTKAFESKEDMRQVSLNQIKQYMQAK